jgi:membrane-bound lytic murein transglycosylase D
MMTQSQRLSALIVLFVSVLFSTGCATTARIDPFGMSFMPPAPRTVEVSAVVTSATEPPRVPANVYLKQTPATFVTPALIHPPRFSETIRRADQHFQAGKRFYQERSQEEARKEFDLALDILLDAPETTDRSALEKKFDELVRSIYRYDVDGLGSGVNAQDPVFERSPLEAILELTFPVDPKMKNKVDDEVRATASQLPLEVNDAVLSYLNYFSSERGRRVMIGGLKRAGRYRALISRVLDEEGVPQELIHLAQAESGFIPRALSSKAAAGMWQFMAFRGAQYGLLQTATTDDRLDPEKATRAAARHLRDLYTEFGDWYLALAAYNCGPGCVDRAVQRTGFADFWELRNRNVLPKETQNYVPAIVAMTIIAKNLKDYGIDNLEVDPACEYDTLEITAPTNITLIADAADRPLSELRDLNPALLKPVAPSGYQMRIPKGSHATVLAALDSVPLSRRASWRVHRSEPGETLPVIARRFNTTLSALQAANNAMDAPEAGDMVLIPAAVVPTPKVVKTYAHSKQNGSKKIVASRHSSSRQTTKTAASKAKPRFRHGHAIAAR